MHPYHLTFHLSNDAICPGCNAKLVPNAWSIRMSIGFCIRCADTLSAVTINTIIDIRNDVGLTDWSMAHQIHFLTPHQFIPADELWHLWARRVHDSEPDYPSIPEGDYKHS